MNAILKEEPADISTSGEALPPELAGTVRRCLEKKPQSRFQSASDLAYNLRTVAAQTGVGGATRRHGVGGRRWRWAVFGGLCVVTAAVAIWRIAPRLETLSPAREIPRIVVLPFENLGAHEDEYFADGITDEITSRLAAVSGLQVISRSSAMRYSENRPPLQQIGEELDVGYVLEGTIRWDRGGEDHGRVRITPQLTRVADDSQLWSERYDRVLEDIFTVQSDIAEQVAVRLEATVLEPERPTVEARPTDNMEAYHSYLVGIRYRWMSQQERYARLTVDSLERAVALDPEFAQALAALSIGHSRLYHYRYDFTPERLEQARLAAERALYLQPGLPEGREALGWYYYWGFRDYDKALEEFAIAANRLPNHTSPRIGMFSVYRRDGRWEEALESLKEWRRVDPQGYIQAFEESETYRLMRQYANAEVEGWRAIAIAPDLPDAYYYSSLNYLLWDGAADRARHLLESARQMDSPYLEHHFLLLDLYDRKPESALVQLERVSVDAISLDYWFLPRELLRCICLAEMGDNQQAIAACNSAVDLLQREVSARPHDYRLHSALGRAFAILGQKEEAVRAGERAVALMPTSKDALVGPNLSIELAKIYALDELLSIPSDLSVGLLRLDPAWDPLRDDPRFQALLEKYDTN
jgi:TolB-like protein